MMNRYFYLILAGLVSFAYPLKASNLTEAIASGSIFPTKHTQTYTIELEPVFSKGFYQTAAICFLGNKDCEVSGGFTSGNDDLGISNEQLCHNEGFSQLKCNSLQVVHNICPYDSDYAKECRCREGLVSCASPLTGVGESCDGKFASCQCPTGVPSGSYGCKEYYPSPCGSVCKTAQTDNCSARAGKTCSDGCSLYYSDCPSKCETCKTPPVTYCDASKIYSVSGCDRWSSYDCVNTSGERGYTCDSCLNGYELKGSGCQRCTGGTTSTNSGPCYLCPSGAYCSNGSMSLCSQGYYCSNPEGTQTAAEMNQYKEHCPDTTWSDAGASKISDCYACPAGNFCFYFLASNGLTYASGKYPCTEGRYCPEGSTSNPNSANFLKYCGAGKWSNASSTKASDCYDCPAGYYCFIDNIYGYATKLKCPTGTTSPKGSSSIDDCK